VGKEVKFLEHNLKDWEWHSINWWRKSEDDEFSIGLRMISKSELLTKSTWIIDIVEEKTVYFKSKKDTAAGILKHYRDIIFPDKQYKYDELEKGKADIDSLIARINNLKLFL
jgi:hypothetical protein